MKKRKKLRKQDRVKEKNTQAISSKKGARKKIWKTILGIPAIFGFLAAIFGVVVYFNPRISVSPSFSVNPRNALLTTFVISNDGYTSIKNVKFAISIKDIKTSDGLHINGDPTFKGRLTEANNIVPVLRANEKYTVRFPSQFDIGSNVTSADIALVVRFTLPCLPFVPWEKMFRYIPYKDVEGKFNWAPQPLSK
jgi:hypothetical protein